MTLFKCIRLLRAPWTNTVSHLSYVSVKEGKEPFFFSLFKNFIIFIFNVLLLKLTYSVVLISAVSIVIHLYTYHEWMWELDHEESWAQKNWCFWTVVLKKTLESPLDYKEIQPVHTKGNQSWVFIGRTDVEAENSNTLATWCEELTHWKRPWYWERLKAGGEGDDKGWDGWTASPTQWTWVWINSGSWWWTGRPGVLQFMGSQRVGHDWATELNLV